jgi:hypothetical protein
LSFWIQGRWVHPLNESLSVIAVGVFLMAATTPNATGARLENHFQFFAIRNHTKMNGPLSYV